MTDRARLLRHLLREDLYTFLSRSFLELEPGNTFAPNWHYQHLCHMLRRIQSGDLRRLIINVPLRPRRSCASLIPRAWRATSAWREGRWHRPVGTNSSSPA